MVESDIAMIEARNLSKYYGSFVAIEDISFRIPAGDALHKALRDRIIKEAVRAA